MEAVGTVRTPRGREGEGAAPDLPPRAGFGVVLALGIAPALAGSLLAGVLGYLLLPLTQLPAPFPDHHQDAETLVFLLAFAVIVPLAARFGPRLADRIEAGPNAAASSLVAATLSAALVALLVGVKVSEHLPWGGGLGVLLVALLVWWAFAAALVDRACSGLSRLLSRAASGAPALWTLAVALAMPAGLAFALLASISLPPLLLGIALTTALAAGYGRGARLSRLPRRFGLGYDLVAVAVVFLAVPNLVIFYPEDPSQGFLTSIIHFHQNFFLGPASNVNGGRAMLVDTLSQYGVGSIDFIAGWFRLAGTSNGTLGLLDGLLSGVVFAAGYFVLRVAGASRLLASAAMTVAVVAFVLNLVYPVGGLLQHGAIRFGMPMAVLAALVAEVRWPRLAIGARALAALVVGISSIWALEAFGYTVLTFAVMIATSAILLPEGTRRRWLLRRAAEALAACVAAHVAFAGATLISSGSLPDWGLYLNTLREFLTGKIGDLTYDFSPWSPGLLVGAVLVASAVATALLLIRKRELARREPALTVALAGSTAYGVALFSYLVNRSADHIVPYVCLPVLIAVTLWLALLLRSPGVSVGARRAGIALVAGGATLLVSVAWSSAGERFSESALGHVVPGGSSLRAALQRLRNPPALSPGAPVAEALLDRYWPDQEEAAVIAEPDLEIEALARTGRINAIPLSDPWEDSFVAGARLGDLDASLAELSAGDRILLDANARSGFAGYRRNPTLDPQSPEPGENPFVAGLAILQSYSLQQLATRFRLRSVARDASGLEVVELVDDPPSATPDG